MSLHFMFNAKLNKNSVMKILIINGPNLNLLGKREEGIYGSVSFEDYLMLLQKKYENDEIVSYQSNHEGDIIDMLHKVGFGEVDAVVLNAGAYTHTSIAISDAIRAIKVPVIEVHISNIHSREEYRHKSYIAASCVGTIAGFGLDSYRLAIEAVKALKTR